MRALARDRRRDQLPVHRRGPDRGAGRSNPDVGIVHAQRADRAGQRAALGHRRRPEGDRARLGALAGHRRGDRRRARARSRARSSCRAWAVGAVAEAPRGAHPSYAHDYYDRDNGFYQRWDEISTRPGRFGEWLESAVYSAEGRAMSEQAFSGRRDDDRRRRARADGRDGLLRRDRPAEHRRQPRPAHPRAAAPCWSTSPARSARSPSTLPLSIGDGELAETADAVVPVPEIFNYWLQGGRIDVGFLGAAQIDRSATSTAR